MVLSVVVTGGDGFVGRHLIHELTSAWPNTTIVSWDRPDVDITRAETYRDLLRSLQPAWVIHLAAVSGVGAGLAAPKVAQQVNVDGTRLLLETIVTHSPQTKVLAVSTADIYGQGSTEPLAELPLTAAQPKNPYAVSKRDMEQMIEARFNDQCIRVRPFPHIGPGQQPGFVTADFASQIVAIEQGKQAPVLAVGNLEAQRDFTDVRDTVRAYRLLLEHGAIGEVYHVASGKAVAIHELLDGLLALSTARISVERDPARMRPADTPVIVGDAKKLTEATGWQPTVSLQQTLADTLAWWRQQQ